MKNIFHHIGMVRLSSTQGHKWVKNALGGLKYILVTGSVGFVLKNIIEVTIAFPVRRPDWNTWWNSRLHPQQPQEPKASHHTRGRRSRKHPVCTPVQSQEDRGSGYKTRQRDPGRVYLGDLQQYDAVLDGLYHALEKRRQQDLVTSRRYNTLITVKKIGGLFTYTCGLF